MAPVRILFLADSHLGFDLPVRPRVDRRRRGHDFFANYEQALAPALAGAVDVVLHGGDVFDTPTVPIEVAYKAFAPLRRIADRDIPVLLVPGNHERGRIPHRHLLSHPGIRIFDRPRTEVLSVHGVRVGFTGFPYVRRNVRGTFCDVLEASDWKAQDADVRLLCMHHCVEGATVGPGNYMFTTAEDVVRHEDVPGEFAAILSGHIHRHQVLTRDLAGRALRTPVLYPGSIERTALAEAAETKGFMHLTTDEDARAIQHEFRPLPARPMLRVELDVAKLTPIALRDALAATIAAAPADAVLVLCVTGTPLREHLALLSAAALRRMTPSTMNIELRLDAFRSRDDRQARPEEPPSLFS